MKERFLEIKELIEKKGFSYELIEHDYVHRSKEAANIRGNKLKEACKALILKAKSGYFLLIAISGDKLISLKKLKKLLKEKNISLASPQEVKEITGLEIGSIAPFPSLYNIKGFVDKSVLRNKFLVFSAGSHYKSIRMKTKDWLLIEKMPIIDISK